MASSGTIRDVASAGPLRIAVEDLTAHLEALEAELSGGRAVELVRGETVIAEMRAPVVESISNAQGAGFAKHVPILRAQMKAIFGDDVIGANTADWVAEGRDCDLLL